MFAHFIWIKIVVGEIFCQKQQGKNMMGANYSHKRLLRFRGENFGKEILPSNADETYSTP